ncbi:hypothetical protein Taro_010586 [Colocasia esculenta]|uniref:Uncharacterized protein n=1 Tax=Colocasia esculenta TaxID=4460 RepID=A0A843TZB9_COLES|nr:hypothetical protein [Colocasia esculenta]
MLCPAQGRCCEASLVMIPAFLTLVGLCGVGTTRGWCPERGCAGNEGFSAFFSRLGHRPCERDGPIGRIHKVHRDSAFYRDLIATGPLIAIRLPSLLNSSRPSHDPVATYLPEPTSPSRPVSDPATISVDPVATLIRTYAEMVKKAQLLEDAMDFTGRIKGKFVKKEMTSSQSFAKPNNGKKRPFHITEGPSQERKPKAIVPNTQTKSNCKHCDKPGHTADESWRKVGALLYYTRCAIAILCAIGAMAILLFSAILDTLAILGNLCYFIHVLDCVVRGYETEWWFLFCVVWDGYWHHEPVVCSRVVASFLSDSWFATGRGLYVVTRRLKFESLWWALSYKRWKWTAALQSCVFGLEGALVSTRPEPVSTRPEPVSTRPELVSTCCPKTAQKVFWESL